GPRRECTGRRAAGRSLLRQRLVAACPSRDGDRSGRRPPVPRLPPARGPRHLEEEPVMANIKSQIKRNRQNELRRQRNKAVRSELKTREKQATNAEETNAEDAFRLAQKRIDQAVTKGVLHKRAAARKK